jgi:hypothetical protein
MAVQDAISHTSVEADLCKELNISRADARDLASYA